MGKRPEQDTLLLLSEALWGMPGLHTILTQENHASGLPLCILQVIFTLPELREFNAADMLTTELVPIHDLRKLCPRTPSLTRFIYTAHIYCDRRRLGGGDAVFISSVAIQAQDTLEVLMVPSESASFLLTQRTVWPRLHTLSLRGRRWRATGSTQWLASALRNMPELTTLTLELAQSNDVPRQALWPSPVTFTEFPCPKLQSLVL